MHWLLLQPSPLSRNLSSECSGLLLATDQGQLSGCVSLLLVRRLISDKRQLLQAASTHLLAMQLNADVSIRASTAHVTAGTHTQDEALAHHTYAGGFNLWT
jgi:hypothetical protein